MTREVTELRFAYLSGGVGGARLARGLCAVLPPERLSIIVNTADDFRHWGLWISPDLDSVMYSVAGLSDEARGWGLLDDRFDTLAAMARLEPEFPDEAPSWFQLGGRDLATHLTRSAALTSGQRLTEITLRLGRALGLRHALLPMSDEPAPSFIHTKTGERLTFQDWLVKRRAADPVARVELSRPMPSAEVLQALSQADVVLFAPSNPYVSLDPILALPGVRERVAARPVVAVSPILAGAAVKGPLAEMIRDLEGVAASPRAVCEHYGGLVSACLVEPEDAAQLAEERATRYLAGDTRIPGLSEATRLARQVIEAAERLCEGAL
ncbi:MAG: 2-phospho-L-lactate transferase [Polyangiaceae bacterium]|nr:2-phospho-L-lactate transferase [Polyangiaceae bacterium]MCW5791338.1 2-phospho-L-lactate transferase [Polyangiaceae bacterium]